VALQRLVVTELQDPRAGAAQRSVKRSHCWCRARKTSWTTSSASERSRIILCAKFNTGRKKRRK
jgi:hypothetical protein